jgi:hypothetical protein
MPTSPFLVCPVCAKAIAPHSVELKCGGCGARYEVVNGNMISLIAPGAVTALDAMDYDAVYSVDAESSDRMYRSAAAFLGICCRQMCPPTWRSGQAPVYLPWRTLTTPPRSTR